MLARELFPITARLTEQGHLETGGCDLVDLAREFGTPLYVYDRETMDRATDAYHRAVETAWPGGAGVAYAAKAWLTVWTAQWAAARGLGLDVVSEGELLLARHAGFPVDRIHAHGNNKPESFLSTCVAEGVGRVVIDHPREAERLAEICVAMNRRQAIWLRLNPATAGATHASVETGSATSKFGLSLTDGSAMEVARFVLDHPNLQWQGIHFHIGSQLEGTSAHVQATRRVLVWMERVRRELGWVPREFSPGGGLFVPYLPGQYQRSLEEAIRELVEALRDEFSRAEFPLPVLVLEPGRELVARAGVAVYRVGAVKKAEGRTYLFVDGGLGDNPRPALYGAAYHAIRASGGKAEPERRYTLAGPFCESGDVWANEVRLPSMQAGDVIAVPSSGAYQLSMASNYNGTPRPAVIVVEQGSARLIQRRESLEMLWARDFPLT